MLRPPTLDVPPPAEAAFAPLPEEAPLVDTTLPPAASPDPDDEDEVDEEEPLLELPELPLELPLDPLLD